MGDAVRLVLLNFGAALLGWSLLGLLPVHLRQSDRAGLALAVGLSSFGVVGVTLAVAGVPPSPVMLGVGIVLAAAAGTVVRRRQRTTPIGGATGRGIGRAIETCVVIGLFVASVSTTLLLAVRPVREWDAWAIWAPKAQALASGDGVGSAVLSCSDCGWPHLDYPILVPVLEALGMRATGGFDGAGFDVQIGFLVLGFALALWALLRGVVPGWLAGVTSLAVVSATPIVVSLGTAYVDVPLALFVALGVVSLAVWLERGDGSLLPLGALFLAAASLTKNEGQLFTIVAFAAVVGVGWRTGRDLRPIVLAALAVAAAILPWRLWLAFEGITNSDVAVRRLLDPGYLWVERERFTASLLRLVDEAVTLGLPTGLLLVATGAALATAVAMGRYALTAFVGCWVAGSLVGLGVVYWISRHALDWHLETSASRVVLSLVITAAATAPLGLAGALGRDDTDAQWARRSSNAA